MKTADDYLAELAGPIRGEYAVPAEPAVPEAIRAPTPEEEAEKYLPPAAPKSSPGTMAIVKTAQGLGSGLADELVGAVNAARTTGVGRFLANHVLGVPSDAPVVGDPNASVGDAYRSGRKAVRDLDEKVTKDYPIASRAVGLGAGAVGAVGTGVLTAGLGPLASGAIQGGVNAFGDSKGDLTKGQFGRVGLDTAVGAGLGGVTSKVISKLLPTGGAAAREYEKQVAKDVTAGADPTHARRAVPDADGAKLVTDFVDKYAPVKKALGDPEKLEAEANRIAQTLGAGTKPIYRELDKAVGEVPVAKIAAGIDDAIAKRGGPGDDAIRAALEDTKKSFLNAPDVKGKDAVPHEVVRQWVTKLLKQETQTMGSLSETARAQIVGDVHQAGHEILDGVLDEATTQAPHLGGQVKGLRLINRDILAASRVAQVASNSDARGFWKNLSFGDKVKQLATVGSVGLGGILGDSSGHGTAGMAVGAAMGAAVPVATAWATRQATTALGQLARAARLGNATATMIDDAIRSGVPASVARAVAAGGSAATGTLGETREPGASP